MDAAFSLDAAAGRWAMAAFVGYLALVTGIGVWAARFSSAGVSEFFLGGRRMGRVVVALSAVVSGRSSWLILGVTGMAYTRGVSAVWAVAGYIVVELLLFLYYARRLRRFTEAYDCITVPDFFAARLGERPGAPAGASGALLRLALVAVILAFMVGYVAAQFVAGGKAFASSFGLDPTTGVLLTAAIVLAYTVLGGFLAVSLTDLVQAIFMLGALVALVAAAVVLGLGASELVFWLVLFSWAGLGAALGPTSILALYWRGTTRAGVLAGLLAGTATTIAWKLTPALSGRLYELIPGFAAGLVATLVVSRLTRPPGGVAEMFAAMGSPAEPGPPGAR
jgi:Na+/proline symporter